jgi:hypothetical protein
VKVPDALNLLAMHADAEARSTAQLIEMIAAACLVKLAPPEGTAVAELVISQADLDAAMREHFYEASYDQHGAMTLRITRLLPDGA